MSETLYLKQIELGPMQNFVYLIGDPETRECLVVDPAWDIDAILNTAAADGMRLRGALVTHTHPDHVGGNLFGFDIPGVENLLEKAPVKVYVHNACPSPLTQRPGALPDDPVLLPGQNYGGAATTIGDEKRQNPMMRFPTMSDFLRVAGGGRVGLT